MYRSNVSLGLSDLLDQDISSYEYFYSLPEDLRHKIQQQDIGSFAEMQSYVEQLRSLHE